MQRHLGDFEEQEFIRKANPNRSHCKFLEECPIACEVLHKNIGDGEKGQPCPNNPVVRHKEIFDRFEKDHDVVMEALYYEGLISLNMMSTNLDEINPIEYQIALCVKRFMNDKELIIKNMSNFGISLVPGKENG